MTNTAGRHHRGNCYHYRTVRSPAATRRSSIEFIRRRTRRFAHEETLTFVSEKSGCRDDNFRRWFVVRVRRSIGGNAWQPGFTRIRRLARSRSFSHSPCPPAPGAWKSRQRTILCVSGCVSWHALRRQRRRPGESSRSHWSRSNVRSRRGCHPLAPPITRARRVGTIGLRCCSRRLHTNPYPALPLQ